VKDESTETPSTTVSATTSRVEDALFRWNWAEPSVWTERMLTALEQGVKGGKWYALIDKVYATANLEEMKHWTPESGAPQGAVLSPLLSNIYLAPLDHLAKQRGLEMVRYADDFVILCRIREEAEAALELVRVWVEAAGLTLHPENADRRRASRRLRLPGL
jgi:RNA-directed DNA polymerase